MERCIRAQFVFYPEAHLFHDGNPIIFCGDEQICDLQVDFLTLQDLQGLEDRRYFTIAQITIKRIGKPFEIDVHRIQDFTKVLEGRRIDESIGMENIQKAGLLCDVADIEHIFIKDCRLPIGVGDGASAHSFRFIDYGLRRHVVTVDIFRGSL